MVCWDIITEQERLAQEVRNTFKTVDELNKMAGNLADVAEESSMQSSIVASAEMSNSINEIAQQASLSRTIVEEAGGKAGQTDEAATSLLKHSEDIGESFKKMEDFL